MPRSLTARFLLLKSKTKRNHDAPGSFSFSTLILFYQAERNQKQATSDLSGSEHFSCVNSKQISIDMKAACEGEDATVRLGTHGVDSSSADSERSHATRNGLICALVVAVCLWAAYPVAEMGFIDDWSYAKTAQVFAETGHFVYNGWGGAMLGWQVLWAALFIKLLGFSFTVLRLSMLPVTMATIFLFHAVLVRFRVNARDAVLGTLTMGLSPLFLPLAGSYMTDISGLFVILLCLYLCQRAIAAENSRATIAWLCLAAASNVAGGTVRQVAWLGALVMVPSAGWLLRKRRGVSLTSSSVWMLSAAGVFALMRWLARQPVPESQPSLKELTFDRSNLALSVHLFFRLVGTALCLSLVVYPILVAWLPKMRRLSGSALLRIAGITLAWGFFQWATKWTMPWLPGDVIQHSLPVWGREATSLLVIATVLVLMEQHELWSRVGNKTIPQLWSSIKEKKVQLASWQDTLWLLGPFTLSYLVLLLPRAYADHIGVNDRYLLPMMPIAIICLLRLHEQCVAPILPFFSVVAMAVFALSAIGGTHDWFASYRAQLSAINEIRASGVPRTAIQGGFEYDGWTQIEESGYINEPMLKVPAGAYHRCKFGFASYTPDVHPKFTIIFPPMWCLGPSNFPPVSYRTWLPPFKGTIYVQEVSNASN